MASTDKGATSPPVCAVVKLGGSLITDKRCWRTLDAEALEEACSQLAAAVKLSSGRLQLVVVHGAGSFGHLEAKRYGIKIGGGPEHAQPASMGVAMTRASVRRLNCDVCDALVRAGLPAVGISPGDCAMATDHFGRALESPASADGLLCRVRDLMLRGCVPVLHGDVVTDAESRRRVSPTGVSILSGDLLVHVLVTGLGAQAGITVSDVPGLLTAPPGSSGAELVSRLTITSVGHTDSSPPTLQPGDASSQPSLSQIRCVATVEPRAGDGAEGARETVMTLGALSTGAAAAGSLALEGGSAIAEAAADDVTGGMQGKVWELCSLALSTQRASSAAESSGSPWPRGAPLIMMVGIGPGGAGGSLMRACRAVVDGTSDGVRGTVVKSNVPRSASACE